MPPKTPDARGVVESFLEPSRAHFARYGTRCYRVVLPELFLAIWDVLYQENVGFEMKKTAEVGDPSISYPAMFLSQYPLVIVSCGERCGQDAH